MGKDFDDRGRDVGGVVRLNKQAIRPVLNDIGDSSDRSRDDRKSRCHGLKNHIRSALEFWKVEEEIKLRIQGSDILYFAPELERVAGSRGSSGPSPMIVAWTEAPVASSALTTRIKRSNRFSGIRRPTPSSVSGPAGLESRGRKRSTSTTLGRKKRRAFLIPLDCRFRIACREFTARSREHRRLTTPTRPEFDLSSKCPLLRTAPISGIRRTRPAAAA
jgi:hypothetical protein